MPQDELAITGDNTLSLTTTDTDNSSGCADLGVGTTATRELAEFTALIVKTTFEYRGFKFADLCRFVILIVI